MKILLRRLITPLGGGIMLFVCWMPWANVSCGDVRTRPNLWQLADYEPMLYVYPALAAIIIILGVVYMIRHHRGLAMACTGVALAAALAWIYFLIRREEMIAQQIAMQDLGGDLGQMMKDIQQDPGTDSELILWEYYSH